MQKTGRAGIERWMVLFVPAGGLLMGQQTCQSCPDADEDDVCDADDICPGGDDYQDSDGDGIPDACDSGSGGGDGNLLLTDATAGKIYYTDVAGTVLAVYDSPVGSLTGVTFDKRDWDGFWVIGNADPDSFYKVSWDGEVTRVLTVSSYSLTPVYGLDYYVGSSPSSDMLVEVGINVNGINVVQGALASDGTRWFESSFYNGTFLSGYWGVDMTGADFGYGYSGWWTTRTAYDTLEYWELTTRYESMASETDAPYGIAVEPDESVFYVVGGSGTVTAIAGGVVDVDRSFSIPDAHLLDISLAR